MLKDERTFLDQKHRTVLINWQCLFVTNDLINVALLTVVPSSNQKRIHFSVSVDALREKKSLFVVTIEAAEGALLRGRKAVARMRGFPELSRLSHTT